MKKKNLAELIRKLEAVDKGTATIDRLICETIHERQCQRCNYTRSLDAAMTLVPDGFHVVCLTTADPDMSPRNPASRCRVVLHPNINNEKGWKGGVANCEKAPSPAIALCIAALKARMNIE